MADEHYTCKQCNTVFASARKRTFCSDKCKWRHKTLQRNPNAILKRVSVACTCRYCRKTYMPKTPSRDKYCSRECAFADRAPIINRANHKPAYSVIYWPECKQCGQTFLSRRKDRLTCSRECDIQKNRDSARDRNASKKIVREIKCACCGSIFTNSYGIHKSKYCSEICLIRSQRSSNKAVRRARARGNGIAEYVNPFKVFDRDKWTCRLCGTKTPRSKRGTYDDNAPELDHIITLAEGGSIRMQTLNAYVGNAIERRVVDQKVNFFCLDRLAQVNLYNSQTEDRAQPFCAQPRNGEFF
jgi:hypothetical protein